VDVGPSGVLTLAGEDQTITQKYQQE
jgi:hypothetical protein